MSKISFLDNAFQGKNNFASYLLTIGITIIGGTLASVTIMILLMVIYIISSGTNALEVQMNIINFNPILLLILVGISYGIYFILFYLCVRLIHKKNFISLINTCKNIKWTRIVFGAFIWGGIMTFFTLLSMIFSQGSDSFSLNFDLWSFLILLVVSILVFPMQASLEEIFFRGYLMQGIGLLSKRPVVPLILTSLIFSMVHFFNGNSLSMSIAIVVSTLIIGLMLGIIVLGENRLETAIGAHIANNMYVALVLNSSDSGLGGLPSLITVQTSDPFSGIPMMILMATMMLIILFWNKKQNITRIFT